MERHLKNLFAVLVMGVLCVAPAAFAADDGQTQPKVNTNATNSSSTPVDLIPSTNGSGNVKGISCRLAGNGSSFPGARVRFTVDGGTVQIVDLYEFMTPYDDGSSVTAYTGWVPFNVRFSSSIRVQIQKTSPSGNGIDCAASWALD